MKDQLSSDLASLRIERDETPRRPAWRGWLLTLALGGLAVVAYRWAVPFAEAKFFKTEVRLTEIGRVSPAQASIDLTSTGYVVPQSVAKVGTKVLGRISRVNVREGEKVDKGALLFELDALDQKSALAAAQARARAAQARAAVARANTVEPRQQRDREKQLAERGAVAKAGADDLSARVQSLEEQTRAAEAEAAAASADVDALAVGLGNLRIVAPIAGTAAVKPAEIGDLATPGATLVELIDFRSLLVETDVPEGRLHLTKIGGPCEIILDAFPDKRLRGSVVEFSPRVNRAKATVVVKVKFTDEAEMVLPDMAARVSFLSSKLDEANMKAPPKVVVPGNAIAQRNGVKGVFIADAGKTRFVPLTLGPPFANGFELKDGPAVGTRLVQDPPTALGDGQPIKEKNE